MKLISQRTATIQGHSESLICHWLGQRSINFISAGHLLSNIPGLKMWIGMKILFFYLNKYILQKNWTLRIYCVVFATYIQYHINNK